MNLQNLQQENGTLLMIKITDNMPEEMKMIQPLNLRQKLLKRIFGITQAHITVTGDKKVEDVAGNTNVVLKNCAPFARCVTHIND